MLSVNALSPSILLLPDSRLWSTLKRNSLNESNASSVPGTRTLLAKSSSRISSSELG